MPSLIPFFRFLAFSFLYIYVTTPFAGINLEFVEAFSSEGMESLTGLAIFNDGTNLYSVSGHSSMGTYNAVNAYTRDTATGKLSLIRSIAYVSGLNELDNARAIAISPDGKNIYVATHDNYKLNYFRRNISSGDISYQGSCTAQGLKYGYAVAVSPDNKNLYVVSSALDVDNTIVVFARDTVVGLLTFLEVHKNDSNGINGMRRVKDCVVSPDGANVYTIGGDEISSDAGLVAFSRDKETGKLTFINSISRTGNDCAISPDGKNVYATGITNNISVYSRNEQSGELTYLSTFTDGENGIDGLNNPSDIAVGPDGKNVFVTTLKDSAVLFFSRNSTTGDLAYNGMVQDSLAGTSGLAWPIDMKISPDGKFLYAAAYHSKSIACFRIDQTTFSQRQAHRSLRAERKDSQKILTICNDSRTQAFFLCDLLGRSFYTSTQSSGLRIKVFLQHDPE